MHKSLATLNSTGHHSKPATVKAKGKNESGQSNQLFLCAPSTRQARVFGLTTPHFCRAAR